jgi:hypothetical protein
MRKGGIGWELAALIHIRSKSSLAMKLFHPCLVVGLGFLPPRGKGYMPSLSSNNSGQPWAAFASFPSRVRFFSFSFSVGLACTIDQQRNGREEANVVFLCACACMCETGIRNPHVCMYIWPRRLKRESRNRSGKWNRQR